MHKNETRKIVGVIAILIVVLGVGVGYIKLKEAGKGGDSEKIVAPLVEEEIAAVVGDGEIITKVDSSNWHLYSIDLYGISFQYPNRIDIQDTLADLYLIDRQSGARIMGVSKPVLKSNVASGYPEKSLPIQVGVINGVNKINGLDFHLFFGEEGVSGKKRYYAVARSREYLSEIMTFGNLNLERERELFSGVIKSMHMR